MSEYGPLPQAESLDTPRNRLAVHLANMALKLASREYRLFVEGVTMLGLQKAAEDLKTKN